MEKLDGLVHFTDVVTQSNNTHKSVPIILSAASAEDYGVIYDEKSIVTAFKEAGFHTVVIAKPESEHVDDRFVLPGSGYIYRYEPV